LKAACCLLIAASCIAAPPDLKHLYPAAGQQGSSTLVTIGKADIWPRIWADTPAIKFSPTPILGAYNVEIAGDAPAGPHLVRAWNEEGASAPRFFIVSNNPELRSSEPNDDAIGAQKLAALPATFSGRLDKNGDVDCYRVELKKGQTLVAWLEAYVLASTFDGLLRITDQAGRVMAFNHDGRTLDPLLAWQVPKDGVYTVQIMGFAHPPQSSVQLTGGEGCVYRLHLTTGPVIRATAPLMARGGEKASLHLLGWNLPTAEVDFDATQFSAGSLAPNSVLAGAEMLQPLRISSTRELLEPEREPPGAPQPLEIGAAVTGRIHTNREEDRYTFTAIKGRAYEFVITAAQAGSALDAWLKLESTDGKELAKDDDTGSPDPKIKWTAPADGIFTVAIGDVTHRSGDDFFYRLAIAEPAPGVTASIAAHSASITAGKIAEVKATVKRANGFAPKVELIAKNLPAGITAAPVEVPDKDGEVTLKLTADASAAPVSQAFQLALREKEGGREHPVRYALAATSEDNGVPQGFAELVIDATDQLWLTVSPEKPTK
jgi:hypothetical protein